MKINSSQEEDIILGTCFFFTLVAPGLLWRLIKNLQWYDWSEYTDSHQVRSHTHTESDFLIQYIKKETAQIFKRYNTKHFHIKNKQKNQLDLSYRFCLFVYVK